MYAEGFLDIYLVPGPDLGIKEHEVLPISHSFLTKFDSGVWW